MKNRKLLVFIIIHLTLTAMWVIMAIFAREFLNSIGVTIIITMTGNGATYIGGNVASAWQKSKYYRPELEEAKDVKG
jgi:hypothetical protein